MTSWAKNLIAKQLAKFAKNLDPNSLSLKFFKGEGELTNLELNEVMLSDLLEFPPWLKLTKVTCNKIRAKVPWTSLKSDPIKLHLDCVEVKIVASEEARERATNLPNFAPKPNAKPAKYGFGEKVVDGMYISINTVMVSFTSIGFKASVNISRIIIQSATPDWQVASNLRQTRIKDDGRGEILNFKEIKWGTMRVDADAAYQAESREIPSTPLRLITNNSAIRLIIKKRLSDSQMIASKLAVILDDILWVLTRSQILKLSSFIHYLIKLRSKFIVLTQKNVPSLTKQEVASPTQSTQAAGQNQLFSAYDLVETSIHLRTHRIDLHLVDDCVLDGNLARASTQSKKFSNDESGAALQISLVNISLDHCPYHVVGKKRTVVKIDDEVAYQRKKWATQLINNFQETEGKQWKSPRNTASGLGQQIAKRRRPIMYESFFVANCQDFQIMQVTTATTSIEAVPFLSSSKEALFLPKEMAALSIDHTTYYYTESEELTVPAPNVFVQVNPIQLTFDPLTCIWLNRFAQSVMIGLDWTKEFMTRESGFVEHVNVRLEALMPKITIPLKNDESLHHSDERPTGMQIQISQAVVSNCRVGVKCSQADILNDLQSFLSLRQYADMSCFPNQNEDYSPLTNSSWLNDFSINNHQLQNLTKRDKVLHNRLKADNNLPHQIWCVWCDQLWIEFTGIEKASSRPVTFLDAFPLRLWICQDVPYYTVPERSISPSSGSSVEVGAELSEGDFSPQSPRSTNSDSNISQLTTSNESCQLTTQQRIAGSTSDIPIHVPSHTGARPNLLNPNKSRFYCDSSEPALRQSHSESDITHDGHNNSPYDTRSLHEFQPSEANYAQGGPPPPYSEGAGSDNSLSSLPPAYDCDEPGEITKPPIGDIIDYETTSSSTKPSLAMLINITKTVQIQLDHFQMLYLIRVSEVVQAMMEKIAIDSERCENERTASLHQCNNVEQQYKQEESLLLNISIPNIIVDLVLAPCFGIDPIQQLNLTDRIEHDKEINEYHLKPDVLSRNRVTLPVRRSASMSSSMSSSPERRGSVLSHSEQRNQAELLDLQIGYKLNHAEYNATRALVNPSDRFFEGSNEYYDEYEQAPDETLKEVRDIAIQAGDSLMKMNLKPHPEQQLVSVLRARLGCVNLGIQSIGKDSIVKVASDTLEVNELGNVKYGKILDPRGNIVTADKNKDKQQINMSALTGDSIFKMRVIVGPKAEQFAKGGEEFGYADIRIKSLAAALLMSTIDNLTEFAEDEFVLPTMPFIVNISNSDISLYDDKPRRYKSAIKLPPQQMIINSLQVQRDCNGVISLNEKCGESSIDQRTSEETDFPVLSNRVHSASVNSTLIPETINLQVDALISENGRLLDDLKVVNAKVNGLHSERESLLKVIDKLQQELMVSNRENDDLYCKVRSLSLSKSRDNFL